MRLLPVALVVLLAGCGGSSSSPKVAPSPAISGVAVFTGLSHNHLTKGQYPQSYPQSPPVGGAHSPAWLKCQVYTEELPKENAVHSEEHGGIWITYQPTLPPAGIATLAMLAQTNREFVMVSPYNGQDAAVIASTWGLALKVQTATDPRLLEFVRTYAGGNQGGEKGVGCASTGVTLQKALEFDASQK